jgi:hypothetical protein
LYVDEPEDALSLSRVPDQILNIDEIGCCSRPMKAKKKSIVHSKARPREAACRKESDLNHLSLVARINLFGEQLKALYVTTNNVALKDPDLQLL